MPQWHDASVRLCYNELPHGVAPWNVAARRELNETMSKTILHRLFGFGKIPKRFRPILESEGIVLMEEGIGGSVTLRNFRAPGRIHSWKRSWFTGSLVLTRRTFAAFALFRPLVYVPLDHERFDELHCSARNGETLCVEFDAAAFHEKTSGSVECRFKTLQARLFVDRLAHTTA